MAGERIPPHNMEAEQSVLGACMLSKDALYDVLEKVREEDFYNKNHGEIFAAIKALEKKGSPVDVLTVSDELARRNSLDMVGGRAYVATLSANVPSTSNAGQYASIVRGTAANCRPQPSSIMRSSRSLRSRRAATPEIWPSSRTSSRTTWR